MDDDDCKLLLKSENFTIATLVSFESVGLNELHILKGWSMDKQPQFYLIVGANPSFTLATQHSKGLIGLLTIDQLEKTKDIKHELLSIKQGINEKTNENILSSELNWTVQDNSDWLSVEKYWKDLLNNIENFAVQKGSQSAKFKGEKFQEYIVDLLRITIFDAKFIGGKNSPDGTVYLKSTKRNMQTELIPLEIKSDSSGIVPIQKYGGQIRKYLEAFTNAKVTDRYQVSRIIMLGKDFDIGNKKDKEVIEKLQNDFNIKFVLFPLKSLARLVNLFFQFEITDVDNDRVDAFLNNGYIEPKHVETLMQELENDAKARDKDLYDKIKRNLEHTGY